MNRHHSLSVFIAAARLGFRQVFAERLTLAGSFFFYAAIAASYAGVFRWIPPGDLADHHIAFSGMVWYLGVTEFVLFCTSSFHFKELQYDIQSGQIYLALLRPCPAWIVRVGEWSGQYAARFVILLIPAILLIGFLAGDFNPGWIRLAGVAASMPMAAVILVCCYSIVGSSCLWFQQAESAFWVWQKALFLLGALLWPLSFYPDALACAAWFTPFPAILAVPGQWVLTDNPAALIGGALHQLFWLAIIILATAAVDRAVLRRIQESGE